MRHQWHRQQNYLICPIMNSLMLSSFLNGLPNKPFWQCRQNTDMSRLPDNLGVVLLSPVWKSSYQVIAKFCSQHRFNIGEMWTKWLTNLAICDLSCASRGTCSQVRFNSRNPIVFWLVYINQKHDCFSKPFYLHPAQFAAGYLVKKPLSNKTVWCRFYNIPNTGVQP